MTMTEAQLKDVMRFHLRNFNRSSVQVTNLTVHKSILSDTDGFGTATSKRIYKSFIRWTLQNVEKNDPAWPIGWMDLTVNELALVLLG
jgi:hypothetical protein